MKTEAPAGSWTPIEPVWIDTRFPCSTSQLKLTFCNQETKTAAPAVSKEPPEDMPSLKDQLLHLLSGCTQRLDFSVLLNLLGNPDLEDIINDHNGKQHDSEDQGSTNHNHFIARLQYPLQVEVID